MTITSDYAPQQYTGNGVTTVFSFPYPFYDNTDLIVSLTVIATGVTTVQTITTHYSVSGGGGSSGSITMVTAPTAAQRLTIERSIPYRQTQDYTENTAFPAETLEQGMDKAVVMAQQVKSLSDYSLKFPTTDALSSIGTIPGSVERANSVLSFDASGVPSAVTLGSLVASYDSVFTGLANNDLIKWNSSTSKWVNTPTITTAQIANLAVTVGKISSGAATSGQVLSADGAGNASFTTVSIPIDGIPNNGYAANRYYCGSGAFDSSGGVAVTANRLYMNVFIVGETKTFTRIGVEVNSPIAGNARLGIYNFANGIPTTLVADLGTVSTGTSGQKEITISQALNKGIYVLACVFDATPTMRSFSPNSFIYSHLLGASATDGTSDPKQCYAALTYGALPGTFGALTYTNNVTVLMWMRAV